MKVFKKYSLSDRDLNRIIEMAWEDRTPFDAITTQFGLSEAEVISLMRYEMHPRNWKKWRRRVQGRTTKHTKKSALNFPKFKSASQKHISLNKISKR